MNALIITLSALLFSIYLFFWIVPYCQKKYMYWKAYRVVKIMAKKYDDPETKEALTDLSDTMKQASKEVKLLD